MILEAIQPDDAIQPLTGMTNRWQKRRYEQDALKVANHLEEINTSFLYEIFNEDIKDSYENMYKYWHKKWTDKVKEICETHKVKHIGIDSHWFERNYTPRHNARG